MRISDWSSDVCSSDLQRPHGAIGNKVPAALTKSRHAASPCSEQGRKTLTPAEGTLGSSAARGSRSLLVVPIPGAGQFKASCFVTVSCRNSTILFLAAKRIAAPPPRKIGRASCRERVCQYV